MMATPTFRQFNLKKPNKGRADFRAADFRALIVTKGMRSTWYKCARCPCEKVSTQGDVEKGDHSPQPDCVACFGTGLIHHNGQTIEALALDISNDPKIVTKYGEMARGMMRLSSLPEHTPDVGDRIVLLDNRMTYQETRIRRSDVERLRWPVIPRTYTIGSLADSTDSTTETTGAAYVRKADKSGTISPEVLEEGIDFDINSSGEIVWTLGIASGSAPQMGTRYSVTYFGRPSYLVMEVPYGMRDTWVKAKLPVDTFRELPRKAICKLEFLGTSNWAYSFAQEVTT